MGQWQWSYENDAAVKGARTKLSEEEFAERMGRRLYTNCARLKDAQNKRNEEECALSMGQRSNDAAVKDAQIMFKREESALDMGRSTNYEPLKVEIILIMTRRPNGYSYCKCSGCRL